MTKVPSFLEVLDQSSVHIHFQNYLTYPTRFSYDLNLLASNMSMQVMNLSIMQVLSFMYLVNNAS